MLRSANGQTRLDRVAATLLRLFPRFLGVMFLYAGYVKYHGTLPIITVLEWDGFPKNIVERLAYTLIAAEVALGLVLLLTKPRRWLLALTGVVMVIYSAQLIALVASNDAPSCGCMEMSQIIANREADRRANIGGLVRNGLILLALGWTWVQLPIISSRGFEVLPAKQGAATENTEDTEKKI